MASNLDITASQASLSISAATTGLALSVLPWSMVADRIGRVRAMRFALVSATILGLIMPWCPWFSALVVIRVLEGVALGGIPGIAVIYLNEEVSAKHAAIAAGTYVSGTTLGGLAGRIIAAPISDLLDWRWGTFTVALVAAIASAVFFFLTPMPRGFQPRPVSVPTVIRAVGSHLRNPRLLVLYGQGFLLMGGFVAVYNYLTFRLEAPPFVIPVGLSSLLFLAYLSGTATSRIAGGLVVKLGRKTVLLSSIGVMIAGLLLTLLPNLGMVLFGLVVMTGGFFGAHSVAAGWSGARATHDRSQSTSLYNFFYYVGSSIFGFLGGFAWTYFAWWGVAGMVIILAVLAGIWVLLSPSDRVAGGTD